MNITAEQRGEVAIIALTGQLDAITASDVRQVFMQYGGDGNCHAVVNLEEVTFIDSSGLAALISGLKTFRAHGRDFVLAGVQPAVLQIFSLTMLDRAFRIYPDTEAAVGAITPSQSRSN